MRVRLRVRVRVRVRAGVRVCVCVRVYVCMDEKIDRQIRRWTGGYRREGYGRSGHGMARAIVSSESRCRPSRGVVRVAVSSESHGRVSWRVGARRPGRARLSDRRPIRSWHGLSRSPARGAPVRLHGCYQL